MEIKQKNARMLYIDGLKFIAAFGVGFSHFYGTFETGVKPYALPSAIVDAYWNNWLVGGLFNGSAWVFVFFAISGFLEAFSVKYINRLCELLQYILKRYIRFSFIIFGGDFNNNTVLCGWFSQY